MASSERTEYQNITMEDVDQSIYDWFDRTVDAFIETPTQKSKKVPVIFASGERWSTARDKRGLRDKNGLLILPLISVRRTGMDRDRTMSALGTEQGTLTIARRVDKKTNTVQNAISSRTLPNRDRRDRVVYELTKIPMPDWFVTTYEITVQSQYIVQMNEIIEKIFNSLDIQNQFVAPLLRSKFEQGPTAGVEFEKRERLQGYYFVGMLDTTLSDAGNFEEFTDQERIVKYSFNVTVPTYLQLDPRGERPAVQTEKTAFEVQFTDENVSFVDDEDELNEIFSPAAALRRLLSLPS